MSTNIVQKFNMSRYVYDQSCQVWFVTCIACFLIFSGLIDNRLALGSIIVWVIMFSVKVSLVWRYLRKLASITPPDTQ